MIGIQAIGSYIPAERLSNLTRAEEFETDEDFIINKIGIRQVARKASLEDTSDLAVKAFSDLEKKTQINRKEIQVIILVTQNPDSNIPHTSAIIHKELGLPESCAAFDISLGCSGFVYGLSVIKGFMADNGFTKGLLFTSDPYSKILNPKDKNTSLLFGDAASVAYITDTPMYHLGKFTFGTIGKESQNLCIEDNYLSMNGRGIFNFAAKYVPIDLLELLKRNNLSKESIGAYVFHQGSKYIIDTLIRRAELPKETVYFDIESYGNTVSSSIPIILEKILDEGHQYIAISGFGVGLSWSSGVLIKVN